MISMPLIRKLVFATLLGLGLTTSAHADGTAVPSKDVAGLKDPAGLPRFTGSVLFLREDVDYDELTLPASKAIYTDEEKTRISAAKTVAVSGKRSRLMYTAPEGRSALEIVRNYQAQLKSQGYATLFECAGGDCGVDVATFGVNSFDTFASFLYPRSELNWEDAAASSCSAGAFMTNTRYALMKNPSSGEVVAVFTHTSGIISVYCDEANWKKHVNATVVYVKPKAMETNMVTLNSSEMSKAISETGRVALYGILFDTGKAEIKPESKAALDEIAKLLKKETTLNLHVVGHTDDQGKLEANFDLSRRRAEAVKDALVKTYGIAATRLTGNGVSSLAPVATNSTDAGRAKNRRVELVPF